jgi:hypothetical protein
MQAGPFREGDTVRFRVAGGEEELVGMIHIVWPARENVRLPTYWIWVEDRQHFYKVEDDGNQGMTLIQPAPTESQLLPITRATIEFLLAHDPIQPRGKRRRCRFCSGTARFNHERLCPWMTAQHMYDTKIIHGQRVQIFEARVDLYFAHLRERYPDYFQGLEG